MVLVGWLVGVLLVIPLGVGVTLGLTSATIAFATLVVVYLVTGIHHLDGVADLGDAMVVHGDAARRRAVLTDTTTGVGALLAVVGVVVGLSLALLSLASAPLVVAVAVVLAAEVGAKTGMALMSCFGRAAHEGLGSQLTSAVDPSHAVLPVAIAIPVTLLAWPHPAAMATFVGALIGVGLPWLWARRHLEGVSGDIFGAANEIGRLLGLHAGVIVWTLW